jgi:hypothetical protein
MIEEQNRPDWENLPEEIRSEWIRETEKFYAPNVVTPEDIVAVAQEDYRMAESLRPPSEVNEEPVNT